MGKQKKSSKRDKWLNKMILLTATIKLIEALIEIIRKLLWKNRGGKPPLPIKYPFVCLLSIGKR